MKSSSLALDNVFIRGGFARPYESRILRRQDTPTLRSNADATSTEHVSKIDVVVRKGRGAPITFFRHIQIVAFLLRSD
jgi:hypothetical protein